MALRSCPDRNPSARAGRPHVLEKLSFPCIWRKEAGGHIRQERFFFFSEEPGPRVYDCLRENGIMGLADRACPVPLCTAGLFAMWMISTTMMGEGSLVLLMHFNKAPGKTRLSVFQWLSSLQDSQGDSLLGSLPMTENARVKESQSLCLFVSPANYF